MVINKKASKIKNFFEILFVGTVFVEMLLVTYIISSHVITESSLALAKYLPFLQLHLSGLQI